MYKLAMSEHNLMSWNVNHNYTPTNFVHRFRDNTLGILNSHSATIINDIVHFVLGLETQIRNVLGNSLTHSK